MVYIYVYLFLREEIGVILSVLVPHTLPPPPPLLL